MLDLGLKCWIWVSNDILKMSSETQMPNLRLKWHFQKCHLNHHSLTKHFSQTTHLIWASESVHMAVRSLPKNSHLSLEIWHMSLRSPLEICHLSLRIWQMSLRSLKKSVIWVLKTVIWELTSEIFITLEALKIFTLCHMCEYVFVCVCILSTRVNRVITENTAYSPWHFMMELDSRTRSHAMWIGVACFEVASLYSHVAPQTHPKLCL